MRRLPFIAFALVATLIAAELYLRSALRTPDRLSILPPNHVSYYTPTARGQPGVDPSRHRFATNEFGFRSDPAPVAGTQVVYVMGSSTSVDVWLDQPDAWPQQMQAVLAQSRPTWVANLSKWGVTTVQSLMYFDEIVPHLPKPDVIVVMAGATDMQRALRSNFPENATAEFERKLAFEYAPPRENGWQRAGFVRLYYRVTEVIQKLRRGSPVGANGDFSVPQRICRQAARDDTLVQILPDLTAGLNDYRTRLGEMAARARSLRARVIFVTHPSLWQDVVEPEERSLLMSGAIGFFNDWSDCRDKTYFSPAVLDRALQSYNAVTKDICRLHSIECVDLASLMPKAARYFFDDLHFTEAGARKTAEIVGHAVAQKWAARSRDR